MAGAGVLNRLLAGQLAGAINAERRRSIVFRPRLLLAAVENVIRGVMDEERVTLGGFFGENARSEGIDGVSQRHLRLSAIDGSVGGGVENDIGRGAADEVARLIGIGEIDGFAIDSDDGPDIGKTLFKLAAKLAGVANDQNARNSRRIGI